MQQIEIHVLEAELVLAGLECLQGLLVAIVGDPQLANDKELGASNAAPCDGLSDLAFVPYASAVSMSR